MYYFKIVQTFERGKPRLTVVPSQWEDEGILFWPRNKAEDKSKEVDSKPETTWLKIACKVKRNFIPTYEEATKELDIMINNSETDSSDDIVYQRNKKTKRINNVPLASNNLPDFSPIIEECLLGEAEVPMSTNDNNNLQQLKTMVETANVATPVAIDNISFSAIDLFDNAKIDKLIKNQEVMLHKIAEIQVMLCDINIEINRLKHVNVNVTEETITENPLGQPIENLEKLEEIENLLANENILNDYIRKLSSICGRNGKSIGLNCCYQLVDIFFSRQFLTQCSWAGGSKTMKEKVPFKIYKNIIFLFFNLIKLADKDFTLDNCESFFKNVIRNSTKRNESSQQRSSKTKNRPTNLSYKAKKSSEDNEGDANATEDNN